MKFKIILLLLLICCVFNKKLRSRRHLQNDTKDNSFLVFIKTALVKLADKRAGDNLNNDSNFIECLNKNFGKKYLEKEDSNLIKNNLNDLEELIHAMKHFKELNVSVPFIGSLSLSAILETLSRKGHHIIPILYKENFNKKEGNREKKEEDKVELKKRMRMFSEISNFGTLNQVGYPGNNFVNNAAAPVNAAIPFNQFASPNNGNIQGAVVNQPIDVSKQTTPAGNPIPAANTTPAGNAEPAPAGNPTPSAPPSPDPNQGTQPPQQEPQPTPQQKSPEEVQETGKVTGKKGKGKFNIGKEHGLIESKLAEALKKPLRHFFKLWRKILGNKGVVQRFIQFTACIKLIKVFRVEHKEAVEHIINFLRRNARMSLSWKSYVHIIIHTLGNYKLIEKAVSHLTKAAETLIPKQKWYEFGAFIGYFYKAVAKNLAFNNIVKQEEPVN